MSTANDWGPLPRLADLLTCSPDGPTAAEETWARAVERYEGLWGVYARGTWPADIRPPTRGSGWWHWRGPRWDWLIRLIRRFRRTTPERPIRRHDVHELADALTECHKWLAMENLRAAQGWFSPAWQYCPVELTALTQRGIAWSLYASGLFEGKAANLPPAGGSSFHALDANSTIGDCIAVHCCVERLVSMAGSRFLADDVPETSRRGGGLRTSRFLRVYPRLAMRAKELGISGWLDRLDRLIKASPLTQLVYLDVLTGVGGDVSFRQLSLVGRLADKEELPSWGDLWISHLARSVLGALLSGPPALEAVQYWQEQERELLPAAQRWAVRYSQPVQSYPRLQEARRKRQNAEGQFPAQHRRRLTILPSVLGLTAGDRGSPYLYLRVFDMLVRSAVAASGREIADQWTRLRDRLPGDVSVREIAFVSGRSVAELQSSRGDLAADTAHTAPAADGAGFEAVRSALFGSAWTTASDLSRWTDGERDAARILLEPPAIGESVGRRPEDSSVEEAAKRSGMTPEAARTLVARFYEQGVELPFPSPNDRGLEPAAILSEIQTALITTSPPKEEVLEETEVTY